MSFDGELRGIPRSPRTAKWRRRLPPRCPPSASQASRRRPLAAGARAARPATPALHAASSSARTRRIRSAAAPSHAQESPSTPAPRAQMTRAAPRSAPRAPTRARQSDRRARNERAPPAPASRMPRRARRIRTSAMQTLFPPIFGPVKHARLRAARDRAARTASRPRSSDSSGRKRARSNASSGSSTIAGRCSHSAAQTRRADEHVELAERLRSWPSRSGVLAHERRELAARHASSAVASCSAAASRRASAARAAAPYSSAHSRYVGASRTTRTPSGNVPLTSAAHHDELVALDLVAPEPRATRSLSRPRVASSSACSRASSLARDSEIARRTRH